MKMLKVAITLVSLMFLATCSQSSPTSSTIQSEEVTTSSMPLTSTIESSKTPEQLCLNVLKTASDWPVVENMAKWNANSGDSFKFALQGDCFNTVRIQALNAGNLWWGETRIVEKIVTLNTTTPVDLRDHVVCHELGHLMGLGHTDDPSSCMNIGLTITHPSVRDLELAGKNTWLFGE